MSLAIASSFRSKLCLKSLVAAPLLAGLLQAGTPPAHPPVLPRVPAALTLPPSALAMLSAEAWTLAEGSPVATPSEDSHSSSTAQQRAVAIAAYRQFCAETAPPFQPWASAPRGSSQPQPAPAAMSSAASAIPTQLPMGLLMCSRQAEQDLVKTVAQWRVALRVAQSPEAVADLNETIFFLMTLNHQLKSAITEGEAATVTRLLDTLRGMEIGPGSHFPF